jgi:hypothetical protein
MRIKPDPTGLNGPTPEQMINDLYSIIERQHTLRPAAQWHDDVGTVLWWHLPIQEPPYVGAGAGMNESDRYGEATSCRRLQEDGWLTHWSPLPICDKLVASDGTEIQ